MAPKLALLPPLQDEKKLLSYLRENFNRIQDYLAHLAGGSGANVNDHFVTGQFGELDVDLVNKLIIPGISANPDIRKAGVNDWEFDSASLTGWSTFAGIGAVSAYDANTTQKSHLYFNCNSNGSVDSWSGLIHAAPAPPYTIVCKFTDFTQVMGWPSLFVSDSATATGRTVTIGPWVSAGSTPPLARGGYFPSFPGFGSWVDGLKRFPISSSCYARMIVHAANNIDVDMSQNGMLWNRCMAGVSNLFTAGYFGITTDPFAGISETLVDWIRFS